MESPDTLTFSADEFNAAPLLALKSFDNQLTRHSFFASKLKLKSASLTLNMSQPLLGQFNLFKVRSYKLTEDLEVVDIGAARLKHCGEDDFYIQDDLIIEVCRRGMCVLFSIKTFEQRVLRLGLKKFFYMNQRDFGRIEDELAEEKQPKFTNSKRTMVGQKDDQSQISKVSLNDQKIALITVDKLKIRAGKNIPFKMFGTAKLNGENLQISFDSLLDSWIICSKNVTLITRDFTDLAQFENNQVFTVSLRITKIWQENLSKINFENENKLKHFLGQNKFCLIGEICGNIKMQHIVHYNLLLRCR